MDEPTYIPPEIVYHYLAPVAVSIKGNYSARDPRLGEMAEPVIHPRSPVEPEIRPRCPAEPAIHPGLCTDWITIQPSHFGKVKHCCIRCLEYMLYLQKFYFEESHDEQNSERKMVGL